MKRGPHKKLPPGDELVVLYEAGADMTQLGRRFGVSSSTIHRYLHLWNVEIRPLGRRRKLHKKALIARRLHEQGLSWRKVGARLLMSGAGAHNLVKRYRQER